MTNDKEKMASTDLYMTVAEIDAKIASLQQQIADIKSSENQNTKDANSSNTTRV